jgi:hypothetical protein
MMAEAGHQLLQWLNGIAISAPTPEIGMSCLFNTAAERSDHRWMINLSSDIEWRWVDSRQE